MLDSGISAGLLTSLEAAAPRLDVPSAWPADQFALLADAGILKWVIPAEYGGNLATQRQMLDGYEALAAACLTTAFVLTQRNGACQRIADSDADELKAALLPKLAVGELFATVGISHLTTSRQHLRQPAVSASMHGEVVTLNGMVPWVTGAPHADYVVTGGTLDDGRQLLLALPTRLDGVEVESPARLLALNGSQTASISLNSVKVSSDHILAGPVAGVMQQGRGGGTGSLTTSVLATGLAGRAIDRLEEEASARPELQESAAPLCAELERLRADMRIVAEEGGTPSGNRPEMSSLEIRRRANSLVLRATQAQLAASKGAGFVAGHPAERAVREALFFLVWSCPQPVLSAALREFACLTE